MGIANVTEIHDNSFELLNIYSVVDSQWSSCRTHDNFKRVSNKQPSGLA